MRRMEAGLSSLFFGFVSGVFLRSFVDFNIYFIGFIFLISFYLFLYFLFLKKTKAKEFIPLFTVAVFLLSFSLGSFRFHISERDGSFTNMVSSHVVITGTVVEEPEERNTTTAIVLFPRHINGTEIQNPVARENKILVTADPYISVQYGDTVTVSGVLEKPKSFQNKYGITFDYVSYLATDNILYTISNGQVQTVSPYTRLSLRRMLYAVKNIFISRLSAALPEPYASLVSGILLGEKQTLPEHVEDELRRTGIIHIVVLSGYNISLVVFASLWVLSFFLPRTGAYAGAVLFVFLFVTMIGFEASVVRAALMSLVVIVGKLLYRRVAPVRILCLVAFIMILWNPYTAAFDPSFQLSFLATLGLIILSPVIEKYFSKIPARFREIASATVAAQILTLPLIIYRSGELPLLSFLVNLLVLPVVPFIMISGFTTACAALISNILATPFSLVTSFLSSYVFSVARFFSELPFSVILVRVSALATGILYIFIFILLSLKKKKTPPRTAEA